MGRTLLAAAVLASCAHGAMADLVPIGTPASFRESFSDPGTYFNFMAITWESGTSFAGGGFGNFSPGDPFDVWSAAATSTLANAWFSSSNPVPADYPTLVDFDILFAGPLTVGTSFVFFAFDTLNYDEPVEALRQTWNGSFWQASNPSFPEGNPPTFGDLAVPVPGAALLGLIGLGVVDWAKKRLA